MKLTVGFVLQNLVTQTNSVEFRDSQIFTFFEVMGVSNSQGRDCLRKSRKLGNDLG